MNERSKSFRVDEQVAGVVILAEVYFKALMYLVRSGGVDPDDLGRILLQALYETFSSPDFSQFNQYQEFQPQRARELVSQTMAGDMTRIAGEGILVNG